VENDEERKASLDYYLGKKICGPRTIRRTVGCLCLQKGEKNLVVTPYWVEKECDIDHSQAEACLEALEADEYGQLCTDEVPYDDERSSWELIRLAGSGKKWLIDPPDGPNSSNVFSSLSVSENRWGLDLEDVVIAALEFTDAFLRGLLNRERSRRETAMVKLVPAELRLSRVGKAGSVYPLVA